MSDFAKKSGGTLVVEGKMNITNHQLSAIFDNEPSAIEEAIFETDFNAYLKRVSSFSDAKKEEIYAQKYPELFRGKP